MGTAGKMLVVAGGVLVVAGLMVLFAEKIPPLGKLPGDIVIRKDHFRMYIPLATSIVLSLLLSVALWIVTHWRGK